MPLLSARITLSHDDAKLICDHLPPECETLRSEIMGAFEHKKRYKFTEMDMKFARSMWVHVQQVAPEQREPNFDEWADGIRLLREADKRTYAQIKEVFLWANKHHFWGRQVRSPQKLRKQWNGDYLIPQMRDEKNGRTVTAPPPMILPMREDV